MNATARRTSTPVACPTCGALTFRGVVNVRVWRGENGAERFYPNGDHAKVCAANVARAAENRRWEDERAAKLAAANATQAATERWMARIDAETTKATYGADRLGVEIGRLFAGLAAIRG